MSFWNQVLSTVKEYVSNQCFDTWFRPVVCHGIKNSALSITVPTESFKKCLQENYASLLLDAAGNIAGIPPDSLKLDILVKPSDLGESCNFGDFKPFPDRSVISAEENEDMPQVVTTPIYAANKGVPLLNPNYTFDNFVVGSSNELAHSAAFAVAEKTAKVYNPLYLFGGAGLGKTHLLHAIGNFIMTRNSNTRLCYLSSEEFLNDFMVALNTKDRGEMLKFRQKYRNFDILLIDDIQFLAGKTGTQIEFFHTFNALYNAQKQIVIASDCAPKQLSTLEERMHSRFECGLIADIQPPDYETKLAFIKKKAQTDLPGLRDDVAQYIAAGIRSNFRELEGTMNRLGAHASISRTSVTDIDVTYARGALGGLVKDEAARISSDSIITAVSSFFVLQPAQLRSKSNAKSVAVPRQIAMYLCRELTHQSFPQIGKFFGGKHHTTVMHSIKKINELRKKDPDISDAVMKITNSISK